MSTERLVKNTRTTDRSVKTATKNRADSKEVTEEDWWGKQSRQQMHEERREVVLKTEPSAKT